MVFFQARISLDIIFEKFVSPMLTESGGTGSGKTTFLNAMSGFIPETERIITIEDSAELQIRQVPNLVRLETRNANAEGEGAIEISDLIRASLRMRPSRISGISGATTPISFINQGFLHQVYPRSMKASNFRHFYIKAPQQIHFCTCCGENRGKFNTLNLSYYE